ncbi:MAG: ChuX/HutX family heme-like substrate-binding protein [Verrucomicrobiota bacterium JB023]|nr:ChuX/HutX family heme-like substrate-binding protein [Verrucomicrobiota bacterium JB023]
MHPESDIEPFQPQSAGRVFRLRPDWEKLVTLLPRLRTSATVYRGTHAIHCQAGAFPSVEIVSRHAVQSRGFRGVTLSLADWSEAWLYEEERFGKMLPCLEIADEQGRGLFKLCYRDAHHAKKDRKMLESFIVGEGDAWDILHLRRANVMHCRPLRASEGRKTNFLPLLKRIQREAIEKGAELGLILPHRSQSTWDSLRAEAEQPAGCWLAFSSGGNHMTIHPDGYHHARLVRSGDRHIASFFTKDNRPALSLVQPEGVELRSFERLEPLCD